MYFRGGCADGIGEGIGHSQSNLLIYINFMLIYINCSAACRYCIIHPPQQVSDDHCIVVVVGTVYVFE